MSAARPATWWSSVSAWEIHWLSFERVLAGVFVLAVLMPYLSPRPIEGMDVQPVAMALAPLMIFSRWLSGDGRLVRGEWWLALIGLGSLLYCLPYRYDGVADYVRTCAPLAIGAAIVIGLGRALRLVSPALMLLVAAAYLVAVTVQLTLPGLYSSAVAPFLSEVRYDPGSVRGPNGLAVEPSIVGNVCALLIAVPSLYREDWWQARPVQRLSLRAMAIVTALLTASVTGILSCVVVMAALYLRKLDARVLWRVLVIALVLAAATVALVRLEPGGRLGDMLAGMQQDPLWILTELSMVLRYAGGLFSLSNLPGHWFGDGVGVITPAIVDRGLAVWAYRLDWNAYYMGEIIGFIESTASGLASVVIRAGVIGIAAIALLFVITARGRYGIVRLLLVWTMLINVSLATPFVWFVIALGIATAMDDRRRQAAR
jgi:hypothetical protein